MVKKKIPSLTNKSEHICYKCLVKACCKKWCSDFYRWLEELQNAHGKISDVTMVHYVVKHSRKGENSWSLK